MSDPLTVALKVAASGLDAQSTRMRVVSENMANAQSTGSTPAADPYRRKVVDFTSVLDQQSGASEVRIDRITTDRTDFSQVYEPGNPAADSKGMVKMPNVNMITEMADMREANRSYEANLQTIRQARNLISMTIDLLRN